VKFPHTQLKYQRVEAEIRQLVHTLPIGAKLPAERDLAVSYDCNFLTVRKALKRLVDDRIIVRRVGSGTFIERHPAEDAGNSVSSPKENRVSILVYQGSNAYAYRLLQAIAHAGMEQKLDLRSTWVRNFDDETLTQVAALKKDSSVALVIPWFPPEMGNEVRRFVMNCPLPVSLPQIFPGLEKNCFEQLDVFAKSSMTTTVEDTCRYYQKLGHQRIALIGPDSANDAILQSKISGYVHYSSRENIPSLFGLVAPGAQAMDQLVERWKAFRGDLAVISYDDEHALRFMTAMHKVGLKAPTDYSIMGYNDTEGSRYSDPPLTTVHQNFDYIAHWLLKNAMALSKGQTCQSTQTPRLQMLVRDTCGGRDKITEAFCAQFQYINITVESGLHHKAPVEEFSEATASAELQATGTA